MLTYCFGRCSNTKVYSPWGACSGTRSDLAELAFFVYFFWQCKKVKASRGSSDNAIHTVQSLAPKSTIEFDSKLRV